MPVLTRRQHMLAPRQVVGVKPSIENDEAISEHLFAVEEDYERPHKEMDFPLTPFGTVPSRKESMNNLRIDTYPSADLHERYLESEEEPSPSPDSESESISSSEEELKHKTPALSATEAAEPVIIEGYKAEIATAVPIMAVGRPRLVDISNLAPMQKRKRSEKQQLSRSVIKNAASHIATPISENGPFVAKEATKLVAPKEHHPQSKESLSALAPNSWLPDNFTVVQEEDDHYFPDLELRNPPSYNDYDPYSLDPPRLSPHNSYNSGKKPGSVARARSNTPTATCNNGWKGLTRSLSVAKKQALHRRNQQVAKKPKMVARAANEREDPLMIPAFPIDELDGRTPRE